MLKRSFRPSLSVRLGSLVGRYPRASIRVIQTHQMFECRTCKDNSVFNSVVIDYTLFVDILSEDFFRPVKCSKCGTRMRNATDPKYLVSKKLAWDLIQSGWSPDEPGTLPTAKSNQNRIGHKVIRFPGRIR